MGTIITSALVAHTAWHWMTGRWGDFRAFPLEAPAMDAAFGAQVLRFAILAVVAAGIIWAGRPVVARLLRPAPEAGSAQAP
jgi:hypothetical protein